jgi:hypothetical protein
MPSAMVYIGSDQIVTAPVYKSPRGGGVEGGPVAVAPRSASPERLGAVVRDVLELSTTRTPDRADTSELLRAFGVRSYRALMQRAEAIDVEALADELRVTPMVNEGPSGGFSWSDEAVRLPPDADATQLGRTMLALIAKVALPSLALGEHVVAGTHEDDESLSTPEPFLADVRDASERAAASLRELGYELDFTPQSLAEVDRFFDDQLESPGVAARGGALETELGPKVFALGSYVGEVIRGALGGEWDAHGLGDGDEEHLAIDLPAGSRIWPIQRVMKRFATGPEESLRAYGALAGLPAQTRGAQPRTARVISRFTDRLRR